MRDGIWEVGKETSWFLKPVLIRQMIPCIIGRNAEKETPFIFTPYMCMYD
jgi:hypothetical protein